MICVDASVAVKWVLQEDHSERARALYDDVIGAGDRIVAPPLLPIEITNILLKQTRASGGPSVHIVGQLLETFLGSAVEIHNPAGLHLRALVLADAFGLTATYDAHYLALAELFGCALWTDDRRLYRAMVGETPVVRLIADFSSATDLK